MNIFEQQKAKVRTQPGFIAALDQSGGSTPKALGLYGIPAGSWSSDAAMMDLMHAMRTRIITSPSFNGERILGAILFEDTMDRDILGRPTAQYLWEVKQVVPILKVDKGLEAEANGVQLMKPMPELDALLAREGIEQGDHFIAAFGLVHRQHQHVARPCPSQRLARGLRLI